MKIIIAGRPPDVLRAKVAAIPASATTLSSVPAYDWSFGCTPTSASMMAAYYDRHGYPNVYVGPSNGGVMPLDNSSWGTVTISGEVRAQCPLSATRNGLDGRTTRGHVDDYWIKYSNADDDPYITNGWTEHAADCLADYMKTNMSSYDNTDGATSLYYYSTGTAYRGTTADDGGYGIELFFESRGYTVVDRFTQQIYGYNGTNRGFTFANYKENIDAGRPVIINVMGHSMLGVGYNDADNTIYLHDTWDYSQHSMKWGEYYYQPDMVHWSCTVIQLAAAATISVTSPAGGESWAGGSSQTVTWSSTNSSGNVSIFLSVDGGSTWPYTLAANISDDGSQQVTIPVINTTTARIRVAFVADPTNVGENSTNFTISSDSTQPIALKSGWNLISSYNQAADPTISAIMAPLGNSLLIMKNGAGKIYWPEMEIDQIENWDVTDGYQVYLTSAATLSVSGTLLNPQTNAIALTTGWNLVSYLRRSAMEIDQALTSIQASLLIVKNNSGSVYWPEMEINTIGAMQPGQGYQIYVTAPATLIYPGN